MVKFPDGGTFISSTDQRPPSSGRRFAVAAAWPDAPARPGIGQVTT